MNDEGVIKEYVDAVEMIAELTEEGHSLKREALRVIREIEGGGDVSKHMKNLGFQCLKCKKVFDTEKSYRVHAGMNRYCGGISPEDSKFDDFTDQMNIIHVKGS